jgi:hypothetical protein
MDFGYMGSRKATRGLWRASCGILGAFLLGLCLAASAEARIHAGPVAMDGGRRLKAAAIQDGMATSLSAAYSFRKVRSAYAGPAVKLRRMSDLVQLDIGFTAQGDFDAAAAAAHCPTRCEIEVWYDQSANARHMTRQAADSADYVANCIGDKPCLRTDDIYVMSTSVAWAAGKTSLSAVANRRSGTGTCNLIAKGNLTNSLQTTAANQWSVTDSTTNSFTLVAADGAWHAGIGVIDGASSVGRIDATETAGTNVTGSAVAGSVVGVYGVAGTLCDMTEAFVWDNYALTQNERIALTQNQKDYWAPLPLDTFATPAAAYSLRRLKSSYAGPGVKLRRVDNNQTQDINFLGFTGFTGAPIDTAAAQSHCSGTTCQIETWYDQSGNGRNVSRVSTNSLVWVPNCKGTLPCARATNVDYLQSASVAWAAGKGSISAVANRSAGSATTCNWVWRGTNYLAAVAANTWGVGDQVTANFSMAAADAAWHAGIGVIAGQSVSSLGRIDGTEMPGVEVWGNTAAGSITIAYTSAAGSTCDMTEGVIWDNYNLSLNERAVLTQNQRDYWGF